VFEQLPREVFEGLSLRQKGLHPDEISARVFVMIESLESVRIQDPQAFTEWAEGALDQLAQRTRQARLHLDWTNSQSAAALVALLIGQSGRVFVSDHVSSMAESLESQRSQKLIAVSPAITRSEVCNEALLAIRAIKKGEQ
jgi:hypothetical protein